MLFDLLVAGRGLRKSPGFWIVATVTLALGIGANTTMFSVVNAVLLRPLPGYDTGRLVRVMNTRHDQQGFVDPEAFVEIRKQSRSFEELAGMSFCQFSLTGIGEPEQIAGPCTSANWFEMQRAAAMIGRTFLPDEDQAGRNRVVVLSNGYWKRRFAADPKISGRQITLDNQPWVVIGVMPPEFQPLGPSQDIYTTDVFAENPAGLLVTGRLRVGVTVEAAGGEMKVIAGRLARANPADWKDIRLEVRPELEQITGPQRPLLLTLFGAVTLVLLIACVNVANLMLSRAASRQQEMDVRVALGATRARIARFVLAESLLIALPASLAACAIAYGGLRALQPLIAGLPRAEEITVDGTVLISSLVFGVLAALLFGTIPAVRAANPEGVGGMRTRSAHSWQRGLLAGEVALAFVLLVGAGLLLQTFVKMRGVSLGYEPRGVLTNMLSLAPSSDGKRTAGAALYARIRERIGALPGVSAVATATTMPTGGVLISVDTQPAGQPAHHKDHRTVLNVISRNYFNVMRIPVLAGRLFESTDREGSTPVMIVSRTIAEEYFGAANRAMGKRIVLPELLFNLQGEDKEIPTEIIAVVGDVCTSSVRDCRTEQIYLPESQAALRVTYILVRSSLSDSADPMSLAGAVKHAVYLETPLTPLDDAQTMEARCAFLTAAPKRAMWLLGLFAALAMMLASIGIFGVSAYLAAQRRQEIGVRMALGAGPGDIVALLLRGAFLAALAGIIAGGLAAAVLARLLEAQLFGVSATDPATRMAAAATLVLIAVLASGQPAWRAARTDPAEVLRRE